MKLYRIWQDVNNGYDTFDEAVVAAEDEESARRTEIGSTGEFGSWVEPEHVKVEYIGEAAHGIEAGVIVSSFNAG